MHNSKPDLGLGLTCVEDAQPPAASERASPQTPHHVTGHYESESPLIREEGPWRTRSVRCVLSVSEMPHHTSLKNSSAASACAHSPASSLSNLRSRPVFPTSHIPPAPADCEGFKKDFISGSTQLYAAEDLFTSQVYPCGEDKVSVAVGREL